MKIVIATRSINEDLYGMASSFWPAHIERKRITGMDDWRDALTYLHALLNIDADYVVNCDEDCFVFDWGVVEDIITHMHGYGLVHAGMPDTLAHCAHRNNGDFIHNPFFNVFAPKAAQNALLRTPWYAHAVTVGSNPPGCQHHEVFNNFFAALEEHARPLDLTGRDHADGISTELAFQRPFALHSWYSREYANPGEHRGRIWALYEEARSRKIHLTPGPSPEERGEMRSMT